MGLIFSVAVWHGVVLPEFVPHTRPLPEPRNCTPSGRTSRPIPPPLPPVRQSGPSCRGQRPPSPGTIKVPVRPVYPLFSFSPRPSPKPSDLGILENGTGLAGRHATKTIHFPSFKVLSPKHINAGIHSPMFSSLPHHPVKTAGNFRHRSSYIETCGGC